MIDVIALPAFETNYIWLLIDQQRKSTVIVDPGDAEPVLAYLTEHDLQPAAIFLTHHHADHSAGIAELLAKYQNLPVYGSNKSPVSFVSHPLQDSDGVHIKALSISFTVLATPGHTHDHLAFYGQKLLFCGDTLFAGGCGRLFEGTAEALYLSLQKLASLPKATKVYCAHEYTLNNLKFALKVDADNLVLKERYKTVQKQRELQQITLPSTVELEAKTNPFLRCLKPAVQSAVNRYYNESLDDPIAIFAGLRAWKDQFKG